MDSNGFRVWEYENSRGEISRVWSDRAGYLFLKLCYGKDGLTHEEYLEYKSL